MYSIADDENIKQFLFRFIRVKLGQGFDPPLVSANSGQMEPVKHIKRFHVCFIYSLLRTTSIRQKHALVLPVSYWSNTTKRFLREGTFLHYFHFKKQG